MDIRGDPRTGQLRDPRADSLMPPPPPTTRDPPGGPMSSKQYQAQESAGVDMYLFYSPRSKACMTFIEKAQKVPSIKANITLINFQEDPHGMLKDNPWLRQTGVPALAIDGDVIHGKELFQWLDDKKSQGNQQGGGGGGGGGGGPPKEEGPSATHFGESALGGGALFSSLSDSTNGEISTGAYSSIGAKQGCEGINHESFQEGSGGSKLSLDALEQQRAAQLN